MNVCLNVYICVNGWRTIWWNTYLQYTRVKSVQFMTFKMTFKQLYRLLIFWQSQIRMYVRECFMFHSFDSFIHMSRHNSHTHMCARANVCMCMCVCIYWGVLWWFFQLCICSFVCMCIRLNIVCGHRALAAAAAIHSTKYFSLRRLYGICSCSYVCCDR